MLGQFPIRSKARVLAGLLLAVGPVLGAGHPAAAATFVSSEAGLRAAYANAATTSITLSANINLTNCGLGVLVRNTATALTIHGNGHTIHQTCANDVFDQNGAGDLTLSGVVSNLAFGRDGISSGGNVTLVDSSFTNVGDGDAITNPGNTTLTRSAIVGIADGDGISSGGAVSLTQSHIDGASGTVCDLISSGGAVTLRTSSLIGCLDAVSSGTNVSVTNSTIVNAGNIAISAGGTVSLSFATIVNNHAGVTSPSLISFGSVVAKSTTTDCSSASRTSHGYNFDGDGTCGFVQATDHSHAGDPHLGALAANGGPTRTLLPQAGSPLLNRIPPAQCTQPTDQRGILRPQGGACEIGAVEILTQGYRVAEANGDVANFGNAQNHGSLPSMGIAPAAPIVGIDGGPTGYRLAGADGAVFSFGSAGALGSLPGLGIHPAKPIVAIAATANGGGFWLSGSDGGVFAFGNGGFQGSLPLLGIHPSAPIVGIAPTANGGGYWLVGADGGVFAFGNGAYLGSLPSLGIHPSAPIVGIAPTANGGGYWLVGADGRVYRIGNAAAFGSVTNPPSPVVGITATPGAGGYWIASANGHVYNFANATPFGSVAAPSGLVVGIASTG